MAPSGQYIGAVRPCYPFGALWWGAPGAVIVVGGIYALNSGCSDAGLVAVVIGLVLCWQAVRNYRSHGRLSRAPSAGPAPGNVARAAAAGGSP